MKYLLPHQIEQLLKVAKSLPKTRINHRNYTLGLLTFRHGLRAVEASCLLWANIHIEQRTIAITRAKNSCSGTHPLQPDELAALKLLHKLSDNSRYVFSNSSNKALCTRSIGNIIKCLGHQAELDVPVNPHMLRHSCGYWLANKGIDTRTIQSWLGHTNIENTVIYTELSPTKFQYLWQ